MNLGSDDGPLTPSLSPKGEREKATTVLRCTQPLLPHPIFVEERRGFG